MVQAKPIKHKILNKTKPIIPLGGVLLEGGKKTKPVTSLPTKSVTKLSHALSSKIAESINFCIMKTNKTGKVSKKKNETLKSTVANQSKFKPKKENPEKTKSKIDKTISGVKKFSKKVSKLINNQTNAGKPKTKTDSCLPVAKVPKTKKLIQPKKKTIENKNNKKSTACAVHNANEKPEPKKSSQFKKQGKTTPVDVNKKSKIVNKNSTKGSKANVNKVLIVQKLEKPSKSIMKNMAVPKLLNLNEAKSKAVPPKKKVNKTPKKIKSDKPEKNNHGDSTKPKIERKPKVESKNVLKKLKKENNGSQKIGTPKPDIKNESKLALVPISIKPGRGRKKSITNLEPNANNQLVLHTGKKVLERKKKIIVNQPKKQRVASLNALAKVHCLYENDINCIKTTSTSINNSETAIIVSRSHRSAPGLRSIGHHWEMLDSSSASSSSSDDSSDHEIIDHRIEERKEENIEIVQPATIAIKELDPSTPSVEESKPKVKRRKRATEIKMDLKDMVVRKRMASLNASAILAASYSSEKRSTVIVKTQEGMIKQKDTKKKQQKEKEEDCEELLLGKRKSKKNKLSVIVEHQDTDVTITVNRSTRSTHERVCSINGMHYCISSTTSHTQTEATTVATEAVLHADNQPPPLPQLTDSSTPCNSYTPLRALSSMTPPGAANPETQRPLYTSSAFTPPGQYRQHDYYQPAGPLISQTPFPPHPSKSHPASSEPVYHPPPPPLVQPSNTMYAPYPPYDTSLHSNYPPHSQYRTYYNPQPMPYSPRYYLTPKDIPAPSNYYPNYVPPSPAPPHNYYQGPPPASLYIYPSAPPVYPPTNASPSSCYSHPQAVNSRLGNIDSTCVNCPCPMQSCSKNVHGPLTINGKGFSKPTSQSQAPLPPVMLAVTLDLPGNLGPPSPARGSTGMPPPPSPALVTARNPDNGLLTTSKLISESMLVTNDDKMKLGVPKCETSGIAGTEFSAADLKQSRKRKLHPIMDRCPSKKVATAQLRDENCLPPASSLDSFKSETQLAMSTSQLLLKPVHSKLNGECTLNSGGSNVNKAVPQDYARLEPKYNNILISHSNEMVHKKMNCLKKKFIEKDEGKLTTLLPNEMGEKSVLSSSLNSSTHSVENKKYNSAIAIPTILEKEEFKKQKSKSSSSSSKHQLQLMRKNLKNTSEASKLSPNSAAVKNLKWSNGWSWEGIPYEASVFLSGDEQHVVRNCYPAMRHIEGDIIQPRDCILLKSGTRKKDLPFIAKVGALWENPEDGEMMVSLLWYYRPEHTEQGTSYRDNKDEIFASRHRDINSVACIEDKCYVLTYREYCRYRKKMRSIEDNVTNFKIIVPPLEEGQYERQYRQPPGQVAPDRVFYCHKVYDFRTKRLLKNPC